jgi:hypothetical protein
MGLFFDVLSAINNPNQQANVEQLGGLTDEIQQITGKFGLDATATQSVVSAIGSQLRPALQQQATSGNPLDIAGLIGKVTGGGANLGALQSMIPPQAQELLLQGIAGKTGLSASSAGELLPSLLPTVLKFLNLGAPTPGSIGTNPLLTGFLDGDKDGDVDLGDVFKFATRFLNAPR